MGGKLGYLSTCSLPLPNLSKSSFVCFYNCGMRLQARFTPVWVIATPGLHLFLQPLAQKLFGSGDVWGAINAICHFHSLETAAQLSHCTCSFCPGRVLQMEQGPFLQGAEPGLLLTLGPSTFCLTRIAHFKTFLFIYFSF